MAGYQKRHLPIKLVAGEVEIGSGKGRDGREGKRTEREGREGGEGKVCPPSFSC